MVLKLRFWNRNRLPVLSLLLASAVGASTVAQANPATGSQRLAEAQALYRQGQYFKAARYAFDAAEESADLRAEANSWITLGLIRAGMDQAATYFFIKTLQSGQKPAIRRVLTETQTLLSNVGADILRRYLIRHTSYDDYDLANRGAYLYALGKDALQAGDEKRAIGYLNGIQPQAPVWPYALQLRATAYALAGTPAGNEAAIRDFQSCASHAESLVTASRKSENHQVNREVRQEREADDLRNRCLAGEARVLYQADRFEEADRAYDRIPKRSIVWTDVLFEQAWNSFGRQEYNRTLGKLVSYKSPALKFVFNTEIDVLRAQSFLALCLYGDANEVINDFNSRYTPVGEEVKAFVERNQSNLAVFYNRGKQALSESIHTNNAFNQMLNRFIRGPYFQNLVVAERDLNTELQSARKFASMQPGVASEPGRGFPGFLQQVLGWRMKTIQTLGGGFVKNSLLDYHAALIADFEKMAFIKLEMLGRAKEKLMYKQAPVVERDRGNITPSRRDDQYYWSFNGEFWNDELGDYVFGLESECGA